MRIGVCGIACEECPRRVAGKCPNGQGGCAPRENKFCKICSCAHAKGIRLCFQCKEFPCGLTGEGPINLGYCQYMSGKQ